MEPIYSLVDRIAVAVVIDDDQLVLEKEGEARGEGGERQRTEDSSQDLKYLNVC